MQSLIEILLGSLLTKHQWVAVIMFLFGAMAIPIIWRSHKHLRAEE
jgi:hypothetical protein